MTIAVRPVEPDEHELVGALTVAAYDRLGDVSDSYRATLADVAARTGAGTNVLVAVGPDGSVLGTVTVVDAAGEHFEHAAHGDGGMRMLAVAPAAQGRGIGGLLVDAALDQARAAGWRRVVLSSLPWMPAAHRVYQARGFVRRPDLDVTFPSGTGLAFALDLVRGAADAFPPPGRIPDVPPAYDAPHDRPTRTC